MSLTVISDFNNTGKSAYLRSLKKEGYKNFWTVFNKNKFRGGLKRHDAREFNSTEYPDKVRKWVKWHTVNHNKLYLDDAEKNLHPVLLVPFGAFLLELSKRTNIVLTTYSPYLVDVIEDWAVIFEAEVKFCMMENGELKEVDPVEIHCTFADPYKFIDDFQYELLIKRKTND